MKNIEHVLIVDDDLWNRELYAAYLNKRGFKTSTAVNGAEAIGTFETWEPDCVVLELMIPVMDGLQFIRWLRGENGSLSPVIVVTVASDRKTKVELLDAGATAVLYKPVTGKQLLSCIQQI